MTEDNNYRPIKVVVIGDVPEEEIAKWNKLRSGIKLCLGCPKVFRSR